MWLPRAEPKCLGWAEATFPGSQACWDLLETTLPAWQTGWTEEPEFKGVTEEGAKGEEGAVSMNHIN